MNLKKLLYSLQDAEHQNLIYKLRLDPKITSITIGINNDYYYFEDGLIKKLKVPSVQEYMIEDNKIVIDNKAYELYVMTAAAQANELITISDESLLHEIDLNTRKIDAPQYLSVQHEHYAETIYFVVDRYYDNMDLTQTNCIIQYETNGETHVYAVPFCDSISIENRIIIPWNISNTVTQYAGRVTFLMRFYLIDDDSVTEENCNFAYCLNTLPATSIVRPGLPVDGVIPLEDYQLETDARYYELINSINSMINNSTLYWIDV